MSYWYKNLELEVALTINKDLTTHTHNTGPLDVHVGNYKLQLYNHKADPHHSDRSRYSPYQSTHGDKLQAITDKDK